MLTEKSAEGMDEELEEDFDEEEEFAEVVIDLRKMLNEYEIVRIVLPAMPGKRVTTKNGSELVFFQEETVS